MITFVLYTLGVAYLISGVIFFAAGRPGYNHLEQTISELGEKGAPCANRVNYGLFLPVSLVFILAAFISENSGYEKPLALCIGAGYFLSAFFPCDPGSPLAGSFKQTLHNIAGIIEYGGGIYFLNQGKHLMLSPGFFHPGWIIVIMIVCISLMLFPGFKLRGLFQRILEFILFGQLLWASYP